MVLETAGAVLLLQLPAVSAGEMVSWGVMRCLSTCLRVFGCPRHVPR